MRRVGFQKAYEMAPKNQVYRTAYYRVRFTDAAMHVTKGRNLVASGDEQGALVELLRARFPNSEVKFIDTVCQPTKQRQNSAINLARHIARSIFP